MRPYTVMVIGGYGFFGSRLAHRLARIDGLHIIIAGRRREPAESLCRALRALSGTVRTHSMALDIHSPDLTHGMAASGADAVIHTGGPFQDQDYRVAEACIKGGVHYIDLADGRAFVSGVHVLDKAARAAGVCVISGASSVPALSGAAVDALARELTSVNGIDIGISPGNRTERGLATVRAILGYCGKRFTLRRDGCRAPTTGWLRPRRFRYPEPVGARWLSDCEVPDLDLLPLRFPGIDQVTFGAGLELGVLHFGMAALAAIRRIGLVSDWSLHAVWLKRTSDLFRHHGSDAGAMHVSVTGRGAEGEQVQRRWTLVAARGDGPFVPTLASTALLRKLAGGWAPPPGAMPCVGLLDLPDFAAEMDGLAIHTECSAC